MKSLLKPSLVILTSLIAFMAVTGSESILYTVISCGLIALYGFERNLEVKSQQVKNMKLSQEFEKVREEMQELYKTASKQTSQEFLKVREDLKNGIDVAKAEAHRISLNGITGGKGVKRQENIRF